jgi:predicted amidophosphoribosyltransferase
MNYCPECGDKVDETDNYCSECGYNLKESSPEYEPEGVLETIGHWVTRRL